MKPVRETSEVIWQDKQHQVLFEVIDQIAEASPPENILPKLRYYAENHFAIEEEYMRKLQYPHRKAHIRAHDQFRKELKSMVEGSGGYDHNFSKLLSMFLSEWLQRHVFGIDKKLERFILESSAK